MAYIGRQPISGQFEKQQLTADGSTTSFALNWSVGSTSALIVSVEEHNVIGGLGSAISELLMEFGQQNTKKFKKIGLPDLFPKGYGRQHNMMGKYMIDYDGCLKTIKKLIF